MPEPSAITRTALDVLGSVIAGGAKVVAVLLVLLVTWNLTLGRHRGGGVTETAEETIMWNDLRNLARAQEIHFLMYGAFETSLPELEFRRSPGVTLEVTLADSAWSALASYANVSTRCAIFVGNIPPPLPGAQEGYPICQELP